jgi:hypothetical protein
MEWFRVGDPMSGIGSILTGYFGYVEIWTGEKLIEPTIRVLKTDKKNPNLSKV